MALIAALLVVIAVISILFIDTKNLLEEAQAANAAYAKTAVKTQKKIEKKQAKIDDVKDNLDTVKDKNKDLKSEVKSLKKANARLEKQIGKAKDAQYKAEVELKKYKQRKSKIDNVINLAKSKLGCRYVHGRCGPYYFDCQGFAWYVYHNTVGCITTGGCHKQFNSVSYGYVSNNLSDAKRGDLIYFLKGSYYSHVALYIGGGKIIHATTGGGYHRVVITSIPRSWASSFKVVRPIPNVK